MRNAAAAHFDDDFEVREPARKKAPRRGASSGSKRKKKGKGRFAFLSGIDTTKVARYSAIGMSATIAVGIMVNALALQKGRHPAPLFGKSIALEETPAPRPVVAKREQPKPAPAPLPVAKPQAAVEPEAEAPATKSDDSDAIAAILQGKPVPVDHPDAKTVMGVQRALVKLGFTVKTTGTFGPQTKKAIEGFEKTHHLPVKGELSRRMIKVLAAESGLKIDR